MSWIIYKHTNKINGKAYIGQTKQTVERRWRNGDGYIKDCDTKFSRAIHKYGWDNFWHEILEDNIENISLANERETFWIRFYNSFSNGYNSNYGGGNREWSEESRIKASKSHKGKKITGVHLENLRKAVLVSARNTERNKKISNALKGREFSLSHKIKISEFAKTRCGSKNSFFGKTHSEATIKKLKEEFGKEVVCLETGVEFVSANEAGRYLGIDGANIRSSCRHGIQAKVGKNWFHFYYKNEQKPIFKYNNIKRVYNLETNEIFENLVEAGKSVGKSSKLIGMCCRGKVETAGNYHWLYFDNYIQSSDVEIKNIINKNNKRQGMKKKVLCIERSEIFNSISEAARFFNIPYTCIAKVCNGKQKTAGNYHWKFVE